MVLLSMSWLCRNVECKLQTFQKWCYAGENEVIIHNQSMHVQCLLSSKWLQWMKFNFHLAVVIIRLSYEIPWIINHKESLEIYLSRPKCWTAVRNHLILTTNDWVQSLQVEIIFFSSHSRTHIWSDIDIFYFLLKICDGTWVEWWLMILWCNAFSQIRSVYVGFIS